jgi:hypothetical protein
MIFRSMISTAQNIPVIVMIMTVTATITDTMSTETMITTIPIPAIAIAAIISTDTAITAIRTRPIIGKDC